VPESFQTVSEDEFSEVPHSPGPMRQHFLCRVSGVRGPMYIRL
jgi:hypothetical protein